MSAPLLVEEEKLKEALNAFKSIMKEVGNFVYQDTNSINCTLPYFRGLDGLFRIGHLPTLKYIGVPREEFLNKKKFTYQWLIGLDKACKKNDKKYGDYLIKE